VQPQESGLLRVVIYGTQNLERLDSGPLAELAFTRLEAGNATVSVLARDPLFAPAEANQGVSLPDEPLVIQGE
jgi:hypothetical protein